MMNFATVYSYFIVSSMHSMDVMASFTTTTTTTTDWRTDSPTPVTRAPTSVTPAPTLCSGSNCVRLSAYCDDILDVYLKDNGVLTQIGQWNSWFSSWNYEFDASASNSLRFNCQNIDGTGGFIATVTYSTINRQYSTMDPISNSLFRIVQGRNTSLQYKARDSFTIKPDKFDYFLNETASWILMSGAESMTFVFDMADIIPTQEPTIEPSTEPTLEPTFNPTSYPSLNPTMNPLATTTTESPSCSSYITTGGTAPEGSECAFPFTYDGVTYNECTNVDNSGTDWCSIEANADCGTPGDTTCVWGNCECTVPTTNPTAYPTMNPVTSNPTGVPTAQPTMSITVDGPSVSGTVGAANSLTFEFEVASLTDTLAVSTCDATGQFNQFPISLNVFGSDGQSIGTMNPCPIVNRRRLISNNTNFNQSVVVINNVSPGMYTATIGNLGGTLQNPSNGLWQVQVFTVTEAPTSNPTNGPTADSESGSTESGSSSESDSSDDALSSLFAAKTVDNLEDDVVDQMKNGDANMDNLYVSFTHSTYINIWAMFAVLITMNGLCCFMCSKRKPVGNVLHESDIM